MGENQQCGAEGPEGLVCTRDEKRHERHVTYMESDGRLYHIEWFECDQIGESKE
jgi:hypothetical protein